MDHWVILGAKIPNIYYSSLSNVMSWCFSLSYMIVNWIPFGFWTPCQTKTRQICDDACLCNMKINTLRNCIPCETKRPIEYVFLAHSRYSSTEENRIRIQIKRLQTLSRQRLGTFLIENLVALSSPLCDSSPSNVVPLRIYHLASNTSSVIPIFYRFCICYRNHSCTFKS